MAKIKIVDYGIGNLLSVQRSLEFCGASVTVSDNPKIILESSRLILPGVGAFGNAMTALAERNLIEPIQEVASRGKPLMGICLGMQLFARSSSEHGIHKGLGWIDADVKRLNVLPPFKVPHVGWNDLNFSSDDWLFKGIRPGHANFYFVHSIHMICHKLDNLVATADHGGPVTAVVRANNLVATQFHPEKSQDNGLTMLKNWVSWLP
jgi:glutamine amidotransferase